MGKKNIRYSTLGKVEFVKDSCAKITSPAPVPKSIVVKSTELNGGKNAVESLGGGNGWCVEETMGGKILTGGNVIESEGNFVQPTIVENFPNADVVKEELFGPVLYIMKFQVASFQFRVVPEVQAPDNFCRI
ncbi:Aldedh domain-containing protein [Forsythia ovata]|uniref:Aldedh domain-containing protein n=1 Tax=Forsythia ovata TaxID=205694 RepID=A0ABD1NUI6_9LAMI